MDYKYLYRGISPEMYSVYLEQKMLTPRKLGQPFKSSIRFDGNFFFNGNATHGISLKNAILQHQTDSSKFITSGISTTPHCYRAIFYAKHNRNTGYILVFDVKLFDQFNINYYKVSDYIKHPNIPEDEEVILVSHDYQQITNRIVIKEEKIY